MKKLVFLYLFIFSFNSCSNHLIKDNGSNEIGSVIKGAFTKNGKIFIFTKKGEKQLLQSDFYDMKPSWSKSSNQLVFFRIINQPKSLNFDYRFWRSKICVMKSDGKGFKELTQGNYADFNPTFMRDGSNRIIFLRYDQNRGTLSTYMTHSSWKSGEEKRISDSNQMIEIGNTSLKDGRILLCRVNLIQKTFQFFLLKPNPGKKGVYERVSIKFDPPQNSLITRFTISPDEKKIAFTLDLDFDDLTRKDGGIFIADFDIEMMSIENEELIRPINQNYVDDYLRWLPSGEALVFHSNRSDKYQLYVYHVSTKQLKRISLDRDSDYLFFVGEKTPK